MTNYIAENKKDTSSQEVKAPATAPGQALGYSLQFTRLAVMLKEAAEGSACSLEVLDDVAEQAVDGGIRLIQSKSALSDNPVADRKISLWKTFYNWVELVKRGMVNANVTSFEIYVSRPVGGDIVDSFTKAKTDSEAALALAAAREELWGPSPDRSKRSTLSAALKQYADTIIEAEEPLLIPIIRNFHLTCGSGSPQADFEKLISQDPVSRSKVPNITNYLCGWVKRQVDKQLEIGLPAIILRDEFHRVYTAYVRSVDRELILKSFSQKPSQAEKIERLYDIFVQQLDLIDVDFDEKLEAISDYLRSSWDRTYWSKAGDVHEDSFDELDDNLNRTWRNLKKRNEIVNTSRSSVDQGKLLYFECMKYHTTIQQMTPPEHFVPGCFHMLADMLEIGWHPEYRSMVQMQIEEKV